MGKGWLPPEKKLNRHFENFIAFMVLKLTVYVRNVIYFFYKPKTGEIPDRPILECFIERLAILRFSHVYSVIVTSYVSFQVHRGW